MTPPTLPTQGRTPFRRAGLGFKELPTSHNSSSSTIQRARYPPPPASIRPCAHALAAPPCVRDSVPPCPPRRRALAPFVRWAERKVGRVADLRARERDAVERGRRAVRAGRAETPQAEGQLATVELQVRVDDVEVSAVGDVEVAQAAVRTVARTQQCRARQRRAIGAVSAAPAAFAPTRAARQPAHARRPVRGTLPARAGLVAARAGA